jgi:hypothetical protein
MTTGLQTFSGYIDTTHDALLILEGVRRGFLHPVQRRLTEKERSSIRSGNVFVFNEQYSGIRRWTDGKFWSPSRILGNFLVYRELDRKMNFSAASVTSEGTNWLATSDTTLKPNGLVKKTISLTCNGTAYHLVAYFTKEDVISGRLTCPSQHASFVDVTVSKEIIQQQNFRRPINKTGDDKSDLYAFELHKNQYQYNNQAKLQKPSYNKDYYNGSYRLNEHDEGKKGQSYNNSANSFGSFNSYNNSSNVSYNNSSNTSYNNSSNTSYNNSSNTSYNNSYNSSPTHNTVPMNYFKNPTDETDPNWSDEILQDAQLFQHFIKSLVQQ